MKVINFEAHNVLRVSDIRCDLEGRHLFVVGGKNGQGKTSALTALLMALCGKREMDYPEMPLRNGENSGWVKVQLSGDDELHETEGLTVELQMRRRRSGTIAEEIRVLDSTGEEAPEPRTLLKRLFSLKAFDPLEFAKLKPRLQMEKIQDMLGVDLHQYDEQRKAYYDQRTRVGRDAKKQRAAADAMPMHSDAPKEEVSIRDLMTELESRQKQNERRRASESEKSDVDREVATLKSRAEEIQQEIDRLMKQLEDVNERLGAAQAKAIELDEDLAGDAYPIADEQEIHDKIAAAEETNRKVRENQKRREAAEQATRLEKEYEQLTAKIEHVDRTKADAIAKANWPVDTMELREDGLLLNGLPFEQASKAERVLASAQVGMALNPKLRLLVCQDGNDLDQDSLNVLEKLLEENDFQMVVEMVSRSKDDDERCAVVIHEGAVVAPPQDAEATAV